MASKFGTPLNDAQETLRKREGGVPLSSGDYQALVEFSNGYRQLLNKDPERKRIAAQVDAILVSIPRRPIHIRRPENYQPIATYPRVEVAEVIGGAGSCAPILDNFFTFASSEEARVYIRHQRALGFTGNVEVVEWKSECSGTPLMELSAM